MKEEMKEDREPNDQPETDDQPEVDPPENQPGGGTMDPPVPSPNTIGSDF